MAVLRSSELRAARAGFVLPFIGRRRQLNFLITQPVGSSSNKRPSGLVRALTRELWRKGERVIVVGADGAYAKECAIRVPGRRT